MVTLNFPYNWRELCSISILIKSIFCCEGLKPSVEVAPTMSAINELQSVFVLIMIFGQSFGERYRFLRFQIVLIFNDLFSRMSQLSPTINQSSAPMPRGIPTPSLLPMKVLSELRPTPCSLTLTTLFSWCVVTTAISSSGAMGVPIHR